MKAAHGREVWLCGIPRCREEGDYSPRWLWSGGGCCPPSEIRKGLMKCCGGKKETQSRGTSGVCMGSEVSVFCLPRFSKPTLRDLISPLSLGCSNSCLL